ncbi:hypothetical protein T07_12029 [Trichinella nelsoni]|uniref:Secreted protein n=1 Tax=Trichinella nelsoni TaxID=6336 RepID=A0A0V0RDA3_9BILA|nr:hypothetical protein T07_12029 [Trichinella nelsoni]
MISRICLCQTLFAFLVTSHMLSENTISPSSLVDCTTGFLKGGKVSTFDNPTTTLITVAVTVNQNQTKC